MDEIWELDLEYDANYCDMVKLVNGIRVPTAKFKIRRIFFYFPNAVWASASGGFRIVSDRLITLDYITMYDDI